MRGRALRRRRHRPWHRFTPAHAGKGVRGHGVDGRPAVHPRACGEGVVSLSTALGTFGSPPRMRGRVGRRARRLDVVRFTPAHAGKGSNIWFIGRPVSVHPRACGEGFSMAWTIWLSDGSPPRMRGRASETQPRLQAFRFTPAHAGKGFGPPSLRGQSPVHPRACGEGYDWKALVEHGKSLCEKSTNFFPQLLQSLQCPKTSLLTLLPDERPPGKSHRCQRACGGHGQPSEM